MTRLSLRDRFFTPPVARAMTSPGGILLAGAGAAAGIVAGLPVAACAAVGAAAWAVRVAVAVPRSPGAERIDPFTLQDPWRSFIRAALDAQRRFDEAVGRTQKGPLRDRMGSIADRLSTGIEECWRIARAGQALADARASIDIAKIQRDRAQLVAEVGSAPQPGTAPAATLEALDAQLASAQRLEALVASTRDRLRLLDAKLNEAVTRAIELSVQAAGADDLGALSQDVDSVVSEMESLRVALAETDTTPVAPPGQLPGALTGDQPTAPPQPGPTTPETEAGKG